MASESLVNLPSSSSSENEDEVTENAVNDTVTKKRGKGKQYHFFASFDTLQLAENSLKKERLWTKVGIRKKVANGHINSFIGVVNPNFEVNNVVSNLATSSGRQEPTYWYNKRTG